MQSEIKDSLLECLVAFTKIHNNPYSAEALTVGLPVKHGSDTELFSITGSKSLFSRAAKRAGFLSTLVKKDIKDISSLVLPCILLLRNKKACILQSVDLNTQKTKIIAPEFGDGVNVVELDALKEEYLGYCYFLKKEFIPEDNAAHLLENSDDHWFWGTIRKSKKIYIDVIIASLVINIFVLASPLFTMNVYDRVVPNNAVETLWVLALGIFVIYIIDLVL